MFKTIASLSALAMTLTGASAAMATPTEASCRETAATNYAIAVAIDAPDADMVHEDTMHDCLESDTEVMSDADFRAFVLEKIASSGASEQNKAWQLESFEFTSRCPNGHYDFANDVDVCE